MLSLRPPSAPPYRAARSTPPRLLPLVVASSSDRSQDDYHSTLKALNSRGRRPRKSLGQHYMLNSSVNEQLSSVADVREGDVVLEIGPGTGSLTNVLIEAGATVIAVEKFPHVLGSLGHQSGLMGLGVRGVTIADPHMATLVRDRFGDTDQIMVLQEDFTKCHIGSHLSSLLESKKSMGSSLLYAKVVSNIPFNISTDVVKQLLPMGDIFSDVVLLLQDETALRLVDYSLRTSEYRPINIFINFYSDPEYKFKVERTNFFPQPNVDAAIVRFKLKQSADYPPVLSVKSFFSMVSAFERMPYIGAKCAAHARDLLFLMVLNWSNIKTLQYLEIEEFIVNDEKCCVLGELTPTEAEREAEVVKDYLQEPKHDTEPVPKAHEASEEQPKKKRVEPSKESQGFMQTDFDKILELHGKKMHKKTGVRDVTAICHAAALLNANVLSFFAGTEKAKPVWQYDTVNSAFNGKRKMLRRSLQHICPSLEIEAALGSVGLPVTSRPEELTMDDFVRLHNVIAKV